MMPAARWLACLFSVSLLLGCQHVPSEPDFTPTSRWTAPDVTFYKAQRYDHAEKPDVPPSYLVLLPNSDGTTGRVSMKSGETAAQELTRPQQGGGLGGEATFAVSDYQLKRDFGAVMAARPALPEKFLLYFEPGRALLNADSQRTLRTVLERAKNFTHLEVAVTGHTDSKGDAIANKALGLKRAGQIAEMLKSAGLRPKGIEVASEGERHPLVPTPDETSEPRNRRVEVVLR